MKHLFLLDPDITFLNHGSFGACPQPVFDVYQRWQRRLERQPVQFIARELFDHLADARARLGEYLHTPADSLAYIPNASFGVNVVARSLDLQPGDQILTTDHEYGACLNSWQYVAERAGAQVIRQPIPLPVTTEEGIVEALFQGVTPHTRLIFISYIASATALRFPAAEVCRRARQHGILTCIDGAHAPGQIDLDLAAIDADFYTGNCHKWMMAPKGSAFLYASADVQSMVEPLVVSWGWGEQKSWERRTPFLDRLEYWGTKDFSAYLSVPAAIGFMQEHDWPRVRHACHRLLAVALERISTYLGSERPFPIHLHDQMGVVQLPADINVKKLQSWLWEQYRIEVPCSEWNGHKLMRISVQGYNTQEDLDRLTQAVSELLR